MNNWHKIFTQLGRLKRDMEMKPQLFELYYEKQMTLQQIGDKFGVTKERIRQIMERLAMPRYVHRHGKRGYKFNDLQEYLDYIKENKKKETSETLTRLIISNQSLCQECGATDNLHIHHSHYPARSRDDLKVLCASCHITKHRKGNGVNIQLKICEQYANGRDGCQLAKQYKVTPRIIYRILRKWGVTVIRKKWSGRVNKPKTQHEICSKYINGKSGIKLAKEYGFRNPLSIYRVLHKWNVEIRHGSASYT